MLLTYDIGNEMHRRKQFMQSTMLKTIKDINILKSIFESNPMLHKQDPMMFAYLQQMLRGR